MAEGTTRGARLLVVDDNKVNRLLLIRSLELQGHSTASAENGRIALEKLRAEPFDLMLLDIEMPELDGFGVLEEMRADHHLREVPVIVTSSLEGLANVVRCLQLGADDYLHKPMNPVLLKARIDSSLEKKRLRDQMRDMVRRFATSEVAEDLQESGFALGGRKLQCTVMFSDIRGFTSLVEAQPPEAVIELLNAYYALMFEAIGSHGGVVNQMVGDGLMAIFGAPHALQDAPWAAVQAALEMQRMLERFNQGRLAAHQARVQVGVGIASGEVIAGYTGTQHRATYTCIGDAVNLAARLEAHTKEVRRTILVDAQTREAVQDRVALHSLGEVRFRGKAAAVGVYAVA